MPKTVLVSTPFKDLNLESLKRFGDLEIIFPTDRPSVLQTRDFIDTVTQWAAVNFTPEDYFVFAGPSVPVSLAFCGVYLSTLRNNSPPKVLIWDYHANEYINGI